MQPQGSTIVQSGLYITGWTMIAGEKADPLINTFEQTVARYGKPEIVMSDGGSAFHSLKGVGKYSRLLEEYGIDHWVTREAAVNGNGKSVIMENQYN